jgi:hypothetical protein
MKNTRLEGLIAASFTPYRKGRIHPEQIPAYAAALKSLHRALAGNRSRDRTRTKGLARHCPVPKLFAIKILEDQVGLLRPARGGGEQKGGEESSSDSMEQGCHGEVSVRCAVRSVIGSRTRMK